MKLIAMALCSMVFTLGLFAQEQEGVELTVYNQNFALVKDKRFFDFKKGTGKIEFRDVASLIEPTSVHFSTVSSPNSSSILEQNYEYDLMNSDKLLLKYIDKNVKIVTQDDRSYEGSLLSYDNNQLVINSSGGLSMITRPDNIKQISFDKIPEGLITKPTLVWLVSSEKGGQQLAEVSYLTGGVNWLCEYVVVLDKEDLKLDIDGWVSLDNRSGTSFNDAKLKLIAGDVKRAREDAKYARGGMMKASVAEAAPQFDEKSFFEYHIYSLQRKTTVKNNQTKQISLLNARAVPIKKEFVFDPSRGDYGYRYYSDEESIKENVRVELEVINSREANLGMPLPQGKVKVYKKDTDASLQFVGEDSIKHTPKNEKIRLYIGDAFDVVGERKRSNFRQEYHSLTETYEISVRNHKESDIDVLVPEKMWRYANWEILNSSIAFEKKDASTIEFKLKVPKDAESKVSYTVKYTW